MALRLAGEDYSVVQGLDNLGWLRNIAPNSPDPALTIDQRGTGNIFEAQDGGVKRLFIKDGGNTLLANAANPPDPESLLHLWSESSGLTPIAGTMLTLENGSVNYINFLGPSNPVQGLIFGDAGSAQGGRFLYRHNSNRFEFAINGVNRAFWYGNSLDFQQAYTISTSTGNLTLNPAGDVSLTDNNLLQGTAFIEQGEIADPAAPAANSARFYTKDNGAGKTQLVVRFPTGAVQILATEP